MTSSTSPSTITNTITNACSCLRCREMCKHPCWPTPAEAEALISAGFGPRLRGALKHRLGDIKPTWPIEPGLTCTFLIDGLCQLHDRGLKPKEGRLAHHSGRIPGLHKSIAQEWNNPAAQELAQSWITKYGKERQR